MKKIKPQQLRRNKGYEATHDNMIKAAVRLIAEKGVDALSIAALSREISINRTTVYYHFDSREKLIEDVKAWSSAQLAGAIEQERSREERIEYINRFVLENPELLKMWIDDALNGRDIRSLYPHWDDLVIGMQQHFDNTHNSAKVDAEIFCLNLLTSAFISPHIFKTSVNKNADNEQVIERFKRESQRMLQSLSLLD